MIGEKQKGNRWAWQTTCSPNVEEMGERPGHGTELVPPIKEGEKYYTNDTKLVLKKY